MRYLNYCQPGSSFYDVAAAEPVDLPAASAPLPDGWTRRFDADWCYVQPPGVVLPGQGWKVHVSATADNAERVLKVVGEYCTRMGLMYKFIRSQWVLLRRNSKYGDRGGSGKFVTIFPVDEGALERVLADLARALEGERGPYILTDLRIGAGPLYVRYGGFVARMARFGAGAPVYCITDPEGRLVPDRRRPGFHVPDWVRIPACLEPHVTARKAGTLRDFPFRATKALHFSNGGGVYLATDTRTGGDVLLKEARPLAGVDESGADAVERLDRERWAMAELAGLDCVPRLVDHRRGHEHFFLAREYVEGRSLFEVIRQRNPVVNAASVDSLVDYTQWALHTLRAVSDAVRAMHDRGVVFGDVHPNNVLIRPDGAVTFIDFETSTPVAERHPQPIGAPGFRAPQGFRGVAVDHYGLGCLQLSAFLPVTVTLAWGPEKADQLLEAIAAAFPVPAGFAEDVRAHLAGHRPGEPPAGTAAATVRAHRAAPSGPLSGPRSGLSAARGQAPVDGPDRPDRWEDLLEQGWPAVRDSLAGPILATATPYRKDRLFPGDVTQFLLPGGGVNLASGAAGVLLALDLAGVPVPESHVDWLVARTCDLADPRPGFGDGLAGVAHVLTRLGRPDQAGAVLDRAASHPALAIGQGINAGPAGVGLVLLARHGSTGEWEPLERAVELAAGLAASADAADGPEIGDGPGTVRRVPAGLWHGRSGIALLFLRLYRSTGDARYLDRAVELVRADLRALAWGRDADPHGQEPTWDTPTLAHGGGGLVPLLADLERDRPEADLIRARAAITAAVAERFQPCSGLLHGSAGALLVLADATRSDPTLAAGVRERVSGLRQHAVRIATGFAFLDDHGLRLSMDLGTGTAGVLLALGAAVGGGRVRLPLLHDGAAPR